MCFVTYLPVAAIGGELRLYRELTSLRSFHYITFKFTVMSS